MSDFATGLCAIVALTWFSGILVVIGADHIRDLARRHRLVAARRHPKPTH